MVFTFKTTSNYSWHSRLQKKKLIMLLNRDVPFVWAYLDFPLWLFLLKISDVGPRPNWTPPPLKKNLAYHIAHAKQKGRILCLASETWSWVSNILTNFCCHLFISSECGITGRLFLSFFLLHHEGHAFEKRVPKESVPTFPPIKWV